MTSPDSPIDLDGMNRARGLMESAVADLNNKLAQTNNEVNLLRSTWTGAASADFNSNMDQWEEHCATVIKELMAMIETMGGNVTAFRSAMAPTYTFNFQIADQVRDNMASTTKAIQATLKNLGTEARSTLAQWEGSTKTAYEDHSAKWNAAADQMGPALGRAEAALAEISGGYLHVEHHAGGMWRS